MNTRDGFTWREIEETTTEPPAIELAPRPPKVRQQKGTPVHVGGMRYAPLPVRAVWELVDEPALLKYLAALCIHCRPTGVTYVTQKRIAALLGRSEGQVSVALRKIEARGFVRRLKTKARWPKHGIRRQVLYEENAPVPTDEIEIAPGPWPFADDPEYRKQYTPHPFSKKGGRLMMTLEQRKALTQNQVGAANAAIGRLGQALQRAGETIDRKCGDLRAEILGFAPAAAGHSTDTAKRWIRMPHGGRDPTMIFCWTRSAWSRSRSG